MASLGLQVQRGAAVVLEVVGGDLNAHRGAGEVPVGDERVLVGDKEGHVVPDQGEAGVQAGNIFPTVENR